jgi:hypothetical protein
MYYILDDLGYIEEVSSHYIERDNKTCFEYTSAIPEGYETLDDWVLNANIRAYKIENTNLVYDADRDAALRAEWAKEFDPYDYSTNEQIVGTWFGKPLYRKVFTTFDVDHIPQEWAKLIDISGMNIGTIVHSTLTCFGGYKNNLPTEQHLYLLQTSNNNNNLDIWGPYYFGNIHTLILEYTKTTD